jgi:deoxyribonuclease-4
MATQNLKAQRFGAHMSVAGGLHLAFERAIEVGCDCLQVFVKNQRQWTAKANTTEEIAAWKTAAVESGVFPVVAHDTYLINLASPDATNRQKSLNAFADELNRCAELGIGYLVTHPGAHMGEGEAAGIARIVESFKAILAEGVGESVQVLLETTAGQGTSLGHRFEHLRDILAGLDGSDRFGVCVDTCHVFAAGYDIKSAEGYVETIRQLEETVGANRVKCFHMNDSKTDLGSRVDRHDGIGEGFLTKEGFQHLVNDPRFVDVPKILETPKGTDEKGRDLDKVNLATLRRLIKKR